MINKYLLRQILKISIFLIVVLGLQFSVFIRPIIAGIEVLADDELLIADFQNGSFEDGDSENPIGWTKVNVSTKPVAKFSFDEETKYIKGRSARVDYHGLDQIFWLQKVKLKPGKTYAFTGRIKTDLKMGDLNSWARFEFWWENENGGFIDPPLVSKKISGKMNWQEIIWTGQPPEEAVAVNIRALMTGNGTSWFDGITWEQEKRSKTIFLAGFIIIVIIIMFLPLFFIKRRVKK